MVVHTSTGTTSSSSSLLLLFCSFHLASSLSLFLHAGVFTIYSAPRVGNAVGYLVDIVYLSGYSPPHDPRDFSSPTAAIVRQSVNETIA